MNLFRSPLFLVMILVLTQSRVWAEFFTTTAGSVSNHIITSREVQIRRLLEDGLAKAIKKKPPQLMSLESSRFVQATDEVLVEWSVIREAQALDVVKVTDAEIERAKQDIGQILFASLAWKSLEVSTKELYAILGGKLLAKKFVRFRSDSSAVPVTDADARRYYAENRLKFGNLPYENFQANITSFLTRQQVERRLQDWYEVLQNKYKAKNFLTE